MSINTNNYNFPSLEYSFLSLGYYGQKPKQCGYPKVLTASKPDSTPQELETSIKKWKRYAWTVLPLLTLIKPVGSITTVITEMAKTAKSVDTLVKHRSLYSAFQTALSVGVIAATVLEPLSPPLRTLFLGIQLLSLAHQTALLVYRYRLDVLNARYQTFLDGGAKRNKVALYVINNLMAMASMVFQHPVVITLFFSTQYMMRIVHAFHQYSKGKYLSASVNIVIGAFSIYQIAQYIDNCFIRFFQTYYQYFDNYLIHPREKIKEKLTAYETKLKNFYGEQFLYFKSNGHQEKFLILTAEADHNGSLDPIEHYYMIYQLSKQFDVKFRTITCVNDIQREIQTATQFGRIMGLMIHAHGNPFYISLSDDPNIALLDAHSISADTFAGLDPQCVIALFSCDTANLLDGVAYHVANCAKRVTYAASGKTSSISLPKLNPLEFSFERLFCSVKTIKIEPLESDSLRSN